MGYSSAHKKEIDKLTEKYKNQGYGSSCGSRAEADVKRKIREEETEQRRRDDRRKEEARREERRKEEIRQQEARRKLMDSKKR